MVLARVRRVLCVVIGVLLVVAVGLGVCAVSRAAADPVCEPFQADAAVCSRLPVHDLLSEDVPDRYKGFIYRTDNYPTSNMVFTDSDWSATNTEFNSSMPIRLPLRLGASISQPSVGLWNGMVVDATWTIVEFNGGAFADYQSHPAITQLRSHSALSVSSLPVDFDRRAGLGVRVDFMIGGEPVPQSFKGVTGFADLDGDPGLGPDEGVELVDGFDAVWKRSDADLAEFGHNGFGGLSLNHSQTDTSGVAAQQHMFVAVFSGSSFTIRYSRAVLRDGLAMVFSAPVFADRVARTVKARALDSAGSVIRQYWTVADPVYEGDEWSVSPPDIEGYTYTRLAEHSAPLTGVISNASPVIDLVYEPVHRGPCE